MNVSKDCAVVNCDPLKIWISRFLRRAYVFAHQIYIDVRHTWLQHISAFCCPAPKKSHPRRCLPLLPWFLGRMVWHMKRCHWRHRFGSWKWPYIVASLHTPCVGKIGLECGDFEGWQAHSMGGGMLGQLEEGGCSTITHQTRSLFQASEE